MNDLQIFTNREFGAVRAVEIDGVPYAVGVDVARVLDYVKPSQAVIDHCKGIRKLGIPSAGGTQQTNLITEGDIYRLIIKAADQSRNPNIKEKAESFEKWLFDEVLPSIRKVGVYATNESAERLLNDPDFLIEALLEIKTVRARNAALYETITNQNRHIDEMAPKAGYCDAILATKDAVSVTVIAKDYGKSAKWLNSFLHERGIQFKQGCVWVPYQKYAAEGYVCTHTHSYLGSDCAPHSKVHTYWTQKGRLFIYNLLKSHGYLPLAEVYSS